MTGRITPVRLRLRRKNQIATRFNGCEIVYLAITPAGRESPDLGAANPAVGGLTEPRGRQAADRLKSVDSRTLTLYRRQG